MFKNLLSKKTLADRVKRDTIKLMRKYPSVMFGCFLNRQDAHHLEEKFRGEPNISEVFFELQARVPDPVNDNENF